jgi:hypothetical protein
MGVSFGVHDVRYLLLSLTIAKVSLKPFPLSLLMQNIESLIVGSEKLTNIFGYWPSFHDAEVLELHFWRGHIDIGQQIYDFPVLILKIHLWELTNQTNSEGYLVLRHHTLTTLRFRDVEDFQMQGFNHQNAIFALSMVRQERTERPSPYFSIELEPAFGISASFKCLGMEVVDATPCDPDITEFPEGYRTK